MTKQYLINKSYDIKNIIVSVLGGVVVVLVIYTGSLKLQNTKLEAKNSALEQLDISIGSRLTATEGRVSNLIGSTYASCEQLIENFNDNPSEAEKDPILKAEVESCITFVNTIYAPNLG